MSGFLASLANNATDPATLADLWKSAARGAVTVRPTDPRYPTAQATLSQARQALHAYAVTQGIHAAVAQQQDAAANAPGRLATGVTHFGDRAGRMLALPMDHVAGIPNWLIAVTSGDEDPNQAFQRGVDEHKMYLVQSAHENPKSATAGDVLGTAAGGVVAGRASTAAVDALSRAVGGPAVLRIMARALQPGASAETVASARRYATAAGTLAGGAGGFGTSEGKLSGTVAGAAGGAVMGHVIGSPIVTRALQRTLTYFPAVRRFIGVPEPMGLPETAPTSGAAQGTVNAAGPDIVSQMRAPGPSAPAPRAPVPVGGEPPLSVRPAGGDIVDQMRAGTSSMPVTQVTAGNPAAERRMVAFLKKDGYEPNDIQTIINQARANPTSEMYVGPPQTALPTRTPWSTPNPAYAPATNVARQAAAQAKDVGANASEAARSAYTGHQYYEGEAFRNRLPHPESFLPVPLQQVIQHPLSSTAESAVRQAIGTLNPAEAQHLTTRTMFSRSTGQIPDDWYKVITESLKALPMPGQ